MPAAPVAPPAPHTAPAPPVPVSVPSPRKGTVPLKIAPTPVVTPAAGAAAEPAPPSLSHQMAEVDEESLKQSFERPPVQPGAVVCRFCKGPLDLAGDFCEQCGAPVAEAAPPGILKPQLRPAEPPAPPPTPPALSPEAAEAAPPVSAPVESAPSHDHSAAPPLAANPATQTEPTHQPAPATPTSPPTPSAEERRSGLMGRLKGLFKKG
jgi:hypothetical protein